MHDLDRAGMGTLHQQRKRPVPEVHPSCGNLHRPSPCYQLPKEYFGLAPLRSALGDSSGLGRQRHFPQIEFSCAVNVRRCFALLAQSMVFEATL
jgi:hypothetical protein